MSVTVTTYRIYWYDDDGEVDISDDYESAEEALKSAQAQIMICSAWDAVVERVEVTPLHAVRMVPKTTKIT